MLVDFNFDVYWIRSVPAKYPYGSAFISYFDLSIVSERYRFGTTLLSLVVG